MGNWDLHAERPASYDERGWRVFIHPSEVQGLWRRRRVIVQATLIFIFLLLPWLEIDGRQALLLDIAQRRFEIFGLSLRAHNTPLMFFVLAIAGFGLFLMTAIWGRVWCGWACPQTVFIESVFRRIETWIEGRALERRKLDASSWTLNKVWKRTLKWSIFLVVSLILTHSFLAYFVGTDELGKMIRTSPQENMASFLFIVVSTGIILFDFGWFREQFCMIACPYGRLQSVLMGSRSMVVGYDETRGEPRRGQVMAGQTQGDCVNCYRCVQVCPTGIDIRRGTQMECIACTACIDACDEVMTKLSKPKGLIRYATLRELGASAAEAIQWRPAWHISPRISIYAAVICISTIALIIAVYRTHAIDIQLIRGKGAPYTELRLPHEHPEHTTEWILNQYFIEGSNTLPYDATVLMELIEPAGAKIVTTQSLLHLRSNKTERIGFFIQFPKALLSEPRGTLDSTGERKPSNSQLLAKLRFRSNSSINPDHPELNFSLIREVPLVGPMASPR